MLLLSKMRKEIDVWKVRGEKDRYGKKIKRLKIWIEKM